MLTTTTITEGRPARRPAPIATDRVLLTPKAHGYLDAMAGLPAYPAAYGSRGGLYLAGYLVGLRDATLR